MEIFLIIIVLGFILELWGGDKKEMR